MRFADSRSHILPLLLLLPPPLPPPPPPAAADEDEDEDEDEGELAAAAAMPEEPPSICLSFEGDDSPAPPFNFVLPASAASFLPISSGHRIIMVKKRW